MYTIVEHREALIENKQFNKLWSKLTCELRSLGPPTFTESTENHLSQKESILFIVFEAAIIFNDFLKLVFNIEGVIEIVHIFSYITPMG